MGLASRLAGKGLPRRPLRLRLTLVYGSLFLVSVIALLALTYVLVDNATQGALPFKGDGGIAGTVDERYNQPGIPAPGEAPELTGMPTNEQMQALRDGAVQQRNDNMNQLLVQGGIALAITDRRGRRSRHHPAVRRVARRCVAGRDHHQSAFPARFLRRRAPRLRAAGRSGGAGESGSSVRAGTLRTDLIAENR
ncbi:hypothetical protein LWC34_26540 [Kibdelosporangium philippinense]|uniref:Uncharacterized protein n=1 Tax=Kibdelosporangium philippinense TaxID=211113 RepID=A0ABS8ZEX4_9PSEU|nr:hypothetical protein [Kibdelosporangium philippinense]MCE7006366.1 hypothetical protein [Kibdelosporangium philippinense]